MDTDKLPVGRVRWQEFLQYVPEGGAAWMYLLLGGITCFGAMFYSRRQQAKRSIA